MKTYILYDTNVANKNQRHWKIDLPSLNSIYEIGVDLSEEIGRYNSYEEMRKAARQWIEDTDGECRLQYVVLGK